MMSTWSVPGYLGDGVAGVWAGRGRGAGGARAVESTDGEASFRSVCGRKTRAGGRGGGGGMGWSEWGLARGAGWGGWVIVGARFARRWGRALFSSRRLPSVPVRVGLPLGLRDLGRRVHVQNVLEARLFAQVPPRVVPRLLVRVAVTVLVAPPVPRLRALVEESEDDRDVVVADLVPGSSDAGGAMRG